ncbi:MAG: inositol monophosphatase family protein, partial [Bacteroidota bacterium]
MTTEELAQLSQQVKTIAIKAGRFLKQELGKVSTRQIEAKSKNSLVSYVDRQAEEIIVAGLQSLLPDAGFLTEEETIQQ